MNALRVLKELNQKGLKPLYSADSVLFKGIIEKEVPVIYIDGGWKEWLPEMRELFEKRCHIVSAQFDDNNRLVINKEELLNALRLDPEEPDIEFATKYMFPVAK